MLDELPQWKERWDILPGVPEEVRRLASDQPYVQVPVWKGFHEVGIGSGEEGAGGCPECVNNRARSRWKQRSPREWRKVTRNERNAKELQTAKTERLYPTVVDAGEQGYHSQRIQSSDGFQKNVQKIFGTANNDNCRRGTHIERNHSARRAAVRLAFGPGRHHNRHNNRDNCMDLQEILENLRGVKKWKTKPQKR